MAITTAGNDYIILGKDNIVISSFKGGDLPEYNEDMLNVIDVTSMDVKPSINWKYVPDSNSYTPAIEPTETVIDEVIVPTPKEKIYKKYMDSILSDVQYMGHTFNFNQNTYAHITGYAACANITGKLPVNFYWLNKQNQRVPMTFDEFKGFCELAANIVFNNFEIYVQDKDNL